MQQQQPPSGSMSPHGMARQQQQQQQDPMDMMTPEAADGGVGRGAGGGGVGGMPYSDSVGVMQQQQAAPYTPVPPGGVPGMIPDVHAGGTYNVAGGMGYQQGVSTDLKKRKRETGVQK
jgi:hypothetical protein